MWPVASRFAVLLLTVSIFAGPVAKPVVDTEAGEVRFTASVHPDAMKRPFGVQGHHAIVWKEGRSHWWALLVSDVSDDEVRNALEALGARAGENLSAEAWTARDDPDNGEPDKRVEGTPVEVLVEWPGSGGRIPLAGLLAEEGRDTPALDLRYGGNARHREEFRSGCIVCLYSCPGGAIGNHAHPIRDYVRDGVIYASRSGRLPAAGTKVTVVLKINDSKR